MAETRTEIVYESDGKLYPSFGTVCTAEEGKTRQEDAASADVNKVLERAMRGAVELPGPITEQVFADVSQVTDFRDAMDRVTRANEAFRQLPATVRREFDNDPALFLDAFQSEEGVRKLDELGVVKIRDVAAERDAEEAAVETRATRRREARELAARLEAAKSPAK